MVAESGARRLALDRREGGGPPVREPSKRGVGTCRITGGVGPELGGAVKLPFAAEDLQCIIDIPLDWPDRFTSLGEVAGARPPGTA